jgi:hypothetical protein
LFAGQSREELRAMYRDAWQRFRAGLPLSPLQAQIATVITEHPEYQQWLDSEPDLLRQDFGPDSGQANPFLHLGLHLAVRDQVTTDRPSGIAAAHRQLVQQRGSAHAADHAAMEALGETLWEAQRGGRAPDERAYLARVLGRLKRG